jgi:hypothetical protein
MSEPIESNPATLTFTLEITRKETGLVEKYDMVGHVIEPQPETPPESETPKEN